MGDILQNIHTSKRFQKYFWSLVYDNGGGVCRILQCSRAQTKTKFYGSTRNRVINQDNETLTHNNNAKPTIASPSVTRISGPGLCRNAGEGHRIVCFLRVFEGGSCGAFLGVYVFGVYMRFPKLPWEVADCVSPSAPPYKRFLELILFCVIWGSEPPGRVSCSYQIGVLHRCHNINTTPKLPCVSTPQTGSYESRTCRHQYSGY